MFSWHQSFLLQLVQISEDILILPILNLKYLIVVKVHIVQQIWFLVVWFRSFCFLNRIEHFVAFLTAAAFWAWRWDASSFLLGACDLIFFFFFNLKFVVGGLHRNLLMLEGLLVALDKLKAEFVHSWCWRFFLFFTTAFFLLRCRLIESLAAKTLLQLSKLQNFLLGLSYQDILIEGVVRIIVEIHDAALEGQTRGAAIRVIDLHHISIVLLDVFFDGYHDWAFEELRGKRTRFQIEFLERLTVEDA